MDVGKVGGGVKIGVFVEISSVVSSIQLNVEYVASVVVLPS